MRKSSLHAQQRSTCLLSCWIVMLHKAEQAIDDYLITRSNPDRRYPGNPQTAAIALDNAIYSATASADAALECLATHFKRQESDFKRLGIIPRRKAPLRK